MASDKFRQELRNESQQWRQDGLITPEQGQQLADRYQFDRLDEQTSNRFTLLLIVVGSVLVGLGIITYVAANWQDIPKVFRTLLLFSLFSITNLSGFYLHQKSDKLQQTLGQGLLLIGGITLGATMALMAQMYHISGPLHPLLITWSFGVVLMAYCLRNSGLGILSALILLWAGGSGSVELRGWGSEYIASGIGYQIAILNLSVIAGLLYLPLAQWTRSRSLFVISIIVSLFNFLPVWSEVRYYSDNILVTNLLGALTLTAPIAFLWSYPKQVDRIRETFQPIARNIGILCLGLLLYICSFRQSFILDTSTFGRIVTTDGTKFWMYAIPGIVILCLMTVFQWSKLVSRFRALSRSDVNLNLTIGTMILIVGGYCFFGSKGDRPDTIFVMNGLLAVLSIGCIRESLETKRRSQFWYGLIVLVLQIVTRFFEYESELILKAMILTLCGFGIIAAGIWFEKYAGRSRTNTSSNSSGDLNS